jgi:hypothetical protein
MAGSTWGGRFRPSCWPLREGRLAATASCQRKRDPALGACSSSRRTPGARSSSRRKPGSSSLSLIVVPAKAGIGCCSSSQRKLGSLSTSNARHSSESWNPFCSCWCSFVASPRQTDTLAFGSVVARFRPPRGGRLTFLCLSKGKVSKRKDTPRTRPPRIRQSLLHCSTSGIHALACAPGP